MRVDLDTAGLVAAVKTCQRICPLAPVVQLDVTPDGISVRAEQGPDHVSVMLEGTCTEEPDGIMPSIPIRPLLGALAALGSHVVRLASQEHSRWRIIAGTSYVQISGSVGNLPRPRPIYLDVLCELPAEACAMFGRVAPMAAKSERFPHIFAAHDGETLSIFATDGYRVAQDRYYGIASGHPMLALSYGAAVEMATWNRPVTIATGLKGNCHMITSGPVTIWSLTEVAVTAPNVDALFGDPIKFTVALARNALLTALNQLGPATCKEWPIAVNVTETADLSVRGRNSEWNDMPEIEGLTSIDYADLDGSPAVFGVAMNLFHPIIASLPVDAELRVGVGAKMATITTDSLPNYRAGLALMAHAKPLPKAVRAYDPD